VVRYVLSAGFASTFQANIALKMGHHPIVSKFITSFDPLPKNQYVIARSGAPAPRRHLHLNVKRSASRSGEQSPVKCWKFSD